MPGDRKWRRSYRRGFLGAPYLAEAGFPPWSRLATGQMDPEAAGVEMESHVEDRETPERVEEMLAEEKGVGLGRGGLEMVLSGGARVGPPETDAME